jgi:hypothetical protein
MQSKPKYTDFPYCYDEERYFVSNMSVLSAHESQQNAAILANKEAIDVNTQKDIENAKLDERQQLELDDLKHKVMILEETIKTLEGSWDVSVKEDITLYPDDNIPSTEEEKAILTITSSDSFNDIIIKLSKAIKSLNNTIDGDIFSIN